VWRPQLHALRRQAWRLSQHRLQQLDQLLQQPELLEQPLQKLLELLLQQPLVELLLQQPWLELLLLELEVERPWVELLLLEVQVEEPWLEQRLMEYHHHGCRCLLALSLPLAEALLHPPRQVGWAGWKHLRWLGCQAAEHHQRVHAALSRLATRRLLHQLHQEKAPWARCYYHQYPWARHDH